MAHVWEGSLISGFATDPVCGSPVLEEGASQFFDGTRTHYFCCAMCRRIFLDERNAVAGARLQPPRAPERAEREARPR
jgi:YHS domain-containing protein